jgi:hypothetical protein
MKLRKIKLALYFGLSLFLVLSIVPQSIAEEDLKYDFLLADSATEEMDYDDYDDYDDYEEDVATNEDEDSDAEDLAEYPGEESVDVDDSAEPMPANQTQGPVVVEKASPVAPPQQLKVEKKPVQAKLKIKPVVKKVAKSKIYKGKFRRLSRDCNMRSIASVSGKKIGMVKKRKKVWTKQVGHKWIQVNRRAGTAFISKSCF